MKNIQMSSDWLRVALLLSEISHSILLHSFGSLGVNFFFTQNKHRKRLFTIIMSLKCKRSVFLMKDKQSVIGRLEKGEEGTNLSAEYGVSKRQISDIRTNKATSMKFADILETSEGLKRKSLKVAHDEQLDKVPYAWFIQQRTSGTPISGPSNN